MKASSAKKEAPKPNAKSAAGSARPAELKGFELAAEKPAPEVPKAAEVVVVEEVAEDPPKTAACTVTAACFSRLNALTRRCARCVSGCARVGCRRRTLVHLLITAVSLVSITSLLVLARAVRVVGVVGGGGG